MLQRNSLVDRCSTNGTAVGTVTVEQDQSCPIKSNYWLVFGRVVCQYVTAEHFYQELRAE